MKQELFFYYFKNRFLFLFFFFSFLLNFAEKNLYHNLSVDSGTSVTIVFVQTHLLIEKKKKTATSAYTTTFFFFYWCHHILYHTIVSYFCLIIESLFFLSLHNVYFHIYTSYQLTYSSKKKNFSRCMMKFSSYHKR